MTLALDIGLAGAVLSQELHSERTVSRKHSSTFISFNRQPGALRRLMQEAKNVWRKKNKGRKWPRPDGACVSKEGREPVQSPLVFPNFKV